MDSDGDKKHMANNPPRPHGRSEHAARYADGVNSVSMGLFMEALHESRSMEDLEKRLPSWSPSYLNDHKRSIAAYLALNPGEMLPVWLQVEENNAINGIFESEGAELERLLEDLPENIREGREILTRLFVCDSTSVN